MEVKIGVQNATRELVIETDLDAEAVQKAVSTALAEGGVLTLGDTRGRRVIVPVDKLGYVEVTTSVSGQVGFRS